MKYGRIDGVTRSLLQWLVLTQSVLLASFVVLAVGYTRLSKSQTAHQFALSSRNALIAGEFRDAMIMASAAVPGSFDAIIFEKDGAPVFSIPHGDITRDRAGIRYWSESVYLYFTMDTEPKDPIGRLIFVGDSFQHVGKAVLVWVFFALVSIPIYGLAYRYLKRKHVAEISVKKAQAIAQTTQMLAHDVRKPFSMLKMAIRMLGMAKSQEDMEDLLKVIVPEVDRAVVRVDGMIADVMEIGSPAVNMMREPASVESLVSNCLDEIRKIYPKADLSITYDYQHKSDVFVNAFKIGRVLANVVDNAVQAIECRGDIWFRTRERESMIEVCIGNAGSYIAGEDIANIFEAFFTRGKATGTGLGLAIAKKIVLSHGGRIWCESSKTEDFRGVVEIWLSLPIVCSNRREHSPTAL